VRIQEDIFQEFFEKLEEDETFPASVVEELKKLLESGSIASQEEILEAIERGSENVGKD